MSEKPQAQKLYKSPKELIVLSISAVVFAIVIYRVYLTGAAEELPPATDLEDENGMPSIQEVFKRANELETRYVPPEPAPVKRNPFQMSDAMRERIYAVALATEDDTPPPVILTRDGMRSALLKIPGAEKAAEAGFKLDAVLISDGWSCAVINEKLIPLGGMVLGFKLVQVSEDRVALELNRHRVILLVATPPATGFNIEEN